MSAAIRVWWLVPATRDGSGDFYVKATRVQSKWIRPGFETHGQRHPKSETEEPVAPQNGPRSNKNFLFKNRSMKTRAHLAFQLPRVVIHLEGGATIGQPCFYFIYMVYDTCHLQWACNICWLISNICAVQFTLCHTKPYINCLDVTYGYHVPIM